MDDIKETVRNSGDRLCRTLTSLTIRLCDVSLTDVSDARQTMNIVLPLLLTDGIMSKVDSIRKSSISIVTKLAKVNMLEDLTTIYYTTFVIDMLLVLHKILILAA